jgi:hypothetical protein
MEGYPGTEKPGGAVRGRSLWPCLRLLAVPAVGLCALTFAGSAGSASQGPSSDLVANALARAARYWRAVPCRGQFRVIADRSVTQDIVYGWATFDTTSEPERGLGAPPSTYTNCVIHLNGAWFGTRRQDAQEWWAFCITVVHEYGHLLGHGHTIPPRPYDVMNAQPLQWGSLPMCGDRPSERYGHARGI